MNNENLDMKSNYSLDNAERIEWLIRMAQRFNFIQLKGKVPIESGWAKYSYEKRQFNHTDFLNCNAGIVTGPSSGVIVLDIDNQVLFSRFVASNNFEVRDTFTVKTAKGEHRYYLYPENKEVNNFPVKHPLFKKVSIFDVRGVGGQVVAPFSIHPETNEIYRIINDVEVAEAPDWLLMDKSNYDLSDLMYVSPGDCYNVEYLNKLIQMVGEEYHGYIVNGADLGSRSEIIAKVIMKLISAGFNDDEVTYILLNFKIGDKAKEKGSGQLEWIQSEIQRCRNNYKPYSKPTVVNDHNPIEADLLIERPELGQYAIPDEYSLSMLNGVVRYELIGRGKQRQQVAISASRNVVYISAVYVDIDNSTQAIELTFLECGVWKSIKVERETVANASKITLLSMYGVNVTSLSSRYLVEYISIFLSVNEKVIPRYSVTSSLGWDSGSNVFLLGNVCVGQLPEGSYLRFKDLHDGTSQMVEGIKASGSYSEWINMVRLVEEYPLVVSYIFGSFVPPILDIIGADNFIYDLAHQTSSGKSITMMLAASAWGDPDKNHDASVVHTWNNTKAWSGTAASVFRSIPLFLDDTKQALKGNGIIQDSSNISSIIYEIAGGKGKGRGAPTGIQRKKSWKTVLMSNGEQKITMYAEGHGGAAARCVSCWGSPFGRTNNRQFVDKLKGIACANYGHAADRYIRYLVTERSAWEDWRQRYFQFADYLSNKAGRNNAAGRISKYLASIVMAGFLMQKAMPELSFLEPGKIVESLWPSVVDGSEESDVGKEAFKYLHSFAIENKSNFFDKNNKQIISKCYGRWDSGSDSISFTSKALKECIQKCFEFHAVVNIWHERGWIITKKNEKKTYSVKINDNPAECYTFSLKQMQQIIES